GKGWMERRGGGGGGGGGWGGPMDSASGIADTGPDPERAAAATQRRLLLERALLRLSEPAREMILLKEIQGLGLDEIAALLEIPIGTVKSRTCRARLDLARAVLALGWSPGGTAPV